jgi:hypothetical protein
MWLWMLEVDQRTNMSAMVAFLAVRKLRAPIDYGLAPVLAAQSRAGASYD